MNFWVTSADTGAQWTRGLIERIRGGAYVFSGEGDPFVGVLADDEENPYATGELPPRGRALSEAPSPRGRTRTAPEEFSLIKFD